MRPRPVTPFENLLKRTIDMTMLATETLERRTYSREEVPKPYSKGALVSLALLQTGLFLVPLIVLGQAIGWPASLRLPASEVLPLIAREAVAVQIGYWAYLLTSLAFVPLAIALRTFAHANGARGLVVDTAVALGAIAGILKTLGIVRWLVAMPALADLYGATADPMMKAAIEVSYVALNGYAGAVGELLGVQLTSGIWLVLTGLILSRIGMRWIGAAAVVTGALFVATCARTLFPELAVLQSVAVPLALLWFPAFAVAIWRRS
jgi:hypothetical protein